MKKDYRCSVFIMNSDGSYNYRDPIGLRDTSLQGLKNQIKDLGFSLEKNTNKPYVSTVIWEYKESKDGRFYKDKIIEKINISG